VFIFKDPNSQTNDPGWPCRNLLALLSFNCSNKSDVKVMSLRDRYKNGMRTISHSLIFSVDLINITNNDQIITTGWERNEKGQLSSRHVDMSQSMNKEKLAESAVDLNLKLMKWRVAESVNLDIIKNTKCLLLGSGTLGCNVSRCLLGWGVKTITFVDNSNISYSNPVRQSLFTFNDCLDANNSFKSLKAAENLKAIYPGVNSTGVVLTIPMPGHFVSESIREKVKENVKTLENLISEHDCIFLLMDTRESRWLPTLIASSQGKFVINSALGFDSFLVMRHGLKIPCELKEVPSGGRIHGSQLGCYFCNDIVGPGDSTKDRTLDQQCTVSRPGLSMIASALAVELMVTCLQHPLKGLASSETSSSHGDSCLGLIPHQIRGYLHNYSNILPASQAFDKCTACSQSVCSTNTFIYFKISLKENFLFLLF
jgi:ubiquitin-like modifier-activating enzyme ATG7